MVFNREFWIENWWRVLLFLGASIAAGIGISTEVGLETLDDLMKVRSH